MDIRAILVSSVLWPILLWFLQSHTPYRKRYHKNCLFSNNETNLLQTFRQGENIEPLIKSLLMKKKAVRAGMNTSAKLEDPKNHSNNRSMITIGDNS